MEKSNHYDINHFRLIIDFIKSQISEEKIRVVMTTANTVSFTKPDDSSLKNFALQSGIDEGYVLFMYQAKIPSIISSVLNGMPASLYRFTESDDDEDIEQMAKIVEEELIDSKLKNRHLLKCTSKVNLIHSIDWEINTKTFDDSKGRIPNLKYAIINFIIQKNDISNIFPNEIFGALKKEEVCVSCDLSDIDLIIDVLCDVREELKKDGDT